MKNVYSYSNAHQKAFTLIEVLVVIALIGILASVVLFNLSDARDSSKVAKAEAELKAIEVAFKLYLQETGAMPPGVDHCSICGWRNANTVTQNLWFTTTNATPAVVPTVSATIPAQLPERDPWGRPYAYDNNYRFSTAARPSIICSVGADGVLDTWAAVADSACEREAQGDDICVFIEEVDDTAPVCP